LKLLERPPEGGPMSKHKSYLHGVFDGINKRDKKKGKGQEIITTTTTTTTRRKTRRPKEIKNKK
jgi:hypothetical protein